MKTHKINVPFALPLLHRLMLMSMCGAPCIVVQGSHVQNMS